MKMKFGVVVPTLNAEKDWNRFAAAILRAVSPEQVLIIDSSSQDRTVELARSCGFRVHIIPAAEFDHGSTRNLGLQLLSGVDFIVYMTQDAVLDKADSIDLLLQSFDNPEIAAAYGRQLPRTNATPIEAHARLFNYPAAPAIRSLEDRKRLGLKTIFISNSFAAYRRSVLESLGGFPCGVIFGEDTLTAARLLLNGWKIAYAAQATVCHSHSHTMVQDLRRNFDIGVAHSRNPQILSEFGGAGGEGFRFVKSEVTYLSHRCPWLLPSAAMRTFLKLLGYRLGLTEGKLPNGIKRTLTMNPRFILQSLAKTN
jgi:rhamnosyltransferase